MRKYLPVLAAFTLTVANFAYLGVTPAQAQEAAVSVGKYIYSADGKRLGAVYKVARDGSPRVIVEGKLVTVPVSSVTDTAGKLVTRLTKREVLASH